MLQQSMELCGDVRRRRGRRRLAGACDIRRHHHRAPHVGHHFGAQVGIPTRGVARGHDVADCAKVQPWETATLGNITLT